MGKSASWLEREMRLMVKDEEHKRGEKRELNQSPLYTIAFAASPRLTAISLLS